MGQVKVGEIVVKEVDGKSSLGDYGGLPLNPAYITGKGYQVRLIRKSLDRARGWIDRLHRQL